MYVKDNIVSHRPDEAMFFCMVKACLHSNNFLFLKKLKEYFLPIIGYKENEKTTLTSGGLALDIWTQKECE